MLQIRKSATRGLAEHGWLSSRHTFSFANYYDPRYVSFGPLRVINEDKVIGGQGFGTTATATWKSSPTCWAVRWNTRTRWAPVRCCAMATCSA